LPQALYVNTTRRRQQHPVGTAAQGQVYRTPKQKQLPQKKKKHITHMKLNWRGPPLQAEADTARCCRAPTRAVFFRLGRICGSNFAAASGSYPHHAAARIFCSGFDVLFNLKLKRFLNLLHFQKSLQERFVDAII